MEEYRSNSHKSREGQTEIAPVKKVEKVVTDTVQTRKKTGVQKLAEAFIAEDMNTVRDYILTDVVIPTIKNCIWEVICDGLGMAMGVTTDRFKRNQAPASRISYSSYYDDRNRQRDDRRSPEGYARSGRSFDDIVFRSRGDAELVLEKMDEMVSVYSVVSVADMYDMAELDCPHTYNKYGWTNLRKAAVKPVKGGYIIDLPRAMPLN